MRLDYWFRLAPTAGPTRRQVNAQGLLREVHAAEEELGLASPRLRLVSRSESACRLAQSAIDTRSPMVSILALLALDLADAS